MAFALGPPTACGGAAEAEAGEVVGDISSVFNSLMGEDFDWPVRFSHLKEELVPSTPGGGASNSGGVAAREELKRAWERLNKKLDEVLPQLKLSAEVSFVVSSHIEPERIDALNITCLRLIYGQQSPELLVHCLTVVHLIW